METLYASGDYEHKVYNGDGTLAAEAVWDASDQKQWIEYWYDAYGRVEDVNYPDGGSIHYTYDGFGRKTQIADYRNSADNIDGTGKISYEYDVLDRVSKITDQDGWIVEYDYMSDGQKSQVKVCHPVDGTVKYHVANLYDKALRLQYVAEPLNGTTTGWIARVDYDDNGNRAGLTYYREGTLEGATTTIAYDYNLDNRLTAYSTSGGPTFALSSVTVDGLGRLVEADETLTKPDSSTITHALDYTYDRRSQLLSASMTNIGGSTWQASYAYDKAGNIYSETINSTPTAFTYDGDLMTGKGQDSLAWDLNGQMTSGITSSMLWTWDGKLQSASAGGSSIDLQYAPGFDRVYKESTVDQTTTKSKYIVDPTGDLSLILLEIDPDENDPNACIRKTYIYANSQVIAQHDGCYGDARYFYLHDRLGSVRQVIDTNADVQNKYVYQPFGESFASEQAENVSNDFKFTGQLLDAEVEQYYLRARQYDPSIHRFPSRDPYEGVFESPLELHRYLYCQNDPLNAVDPSGKLLAMTLRAKEAEVKVGIAAAVTATLAYYIYARNFAFNMSISAIEFDLDGLLAVGTSLASRVTGTIVVGAEAPAIPDDATIPPGPGWEWRGKGQPGSAEGSWYNPGTEEVLRPDVNHAPPVGPHWDYKDKSGKWWRVKPDGTMEPKQ